MTLFIFLQNFHLDFHFDIDARLCSSFHTMSDSHMQRTIDDVANELVMLANDGICVMYVDSFSLA